MTKTLMTRCAAVAIVASAALPATAVMAQDAASAQPTIVLPDSAPAPDTTQTAPAPVVLPQTTTSSPSSSPIVLPETMPSASSVPSIAPNAVEPVAPETPVSAVTSPREKAPASSTEHQTAKSAAPAPARAASEAQPATPQQTFVAPMAAPNAANDTASSPAGEQSVASPSPTVADASNGQTDEGVLMGIAGALGLLVIGGIGYLAMRRRRHVPPYADTTTEVVEEPVVYENEDIAEPAPIATQTASATPMAAGFAPSIADARNSRRPMTRVQTSSGANDPVVLPPEVPESFEERDALLKQLIAAEPDRANPFRSKRARAHRAKLIIQSLGRSFERTKPRIDLSQYSDRWPALRGWQPATA